MVGLSVDETAHVMRVWRAAADATELDTTTEPDEALHLSHTLDQRWELTGSFGNDSGQIIAAAIDVQLFATGDWAEQLQVPAVRRAQALVDICRFFLDNQHLTEGGRHRPHITLVADLDRLDTGGRYLDGSPISPELLGVILCDSAQSCLVARGADILQHNAETRTVSQPMRRAVVIRDQRCRFPGCDRPHHWCEAHHVVRWADGGRTVITNLVLLCSRHHHRIHQQSWECGIESDGTFTVTDPNGHTRSTRPPGAWGLAA